MHSRERKNKMENIFPKPPQLLPEELYATLAVSLLVILAVWRLAKVLPAAIKPILSLWVKNEKLRCYSLLQLLLAIYWLGTVTQAEFPELKEAFDNEDRLRFWAALFVMVVIFSSFIYKVALFIFANYLVKQA